MKRNLQLFIRGLLYVFYLASVVPFLFISASDFSSELNLALLGESSDSPQHAGMAAMVSVLGPVALMFFFGATALSIYVWWGGISTLRVRISFWYCLLFVVVIVLIFGPYASQFSRRVYFSLYQIILIFPLAALPVFWLYKDSRNNRIEATIPKLNTPAN